MENRSHALIAGLFTLVLGAGLVAAAAWLGERQEFSERYVLVSEVGIGGLNPQAAVRYRGVQVGRVEAVRFDPQAPQTILIDVSLAPVVLITTRTYGRLGYQGVTGLAFVELDDDGKTGEPVATRPGDPARIPMRQSTLQEFGDAGQLLLVRINEIAQRMSFLLNEENQGRMANSLASIERMTERFVSFQDKLLPTLDALPRLTERADHVLARSEALVAGLEELTQETRQRLHVLDRVGEGAERISAAAGDFSGGTLPSLNRLAEKLSRSAESLERMLEAQSREPQGLLFGPRPPEPGPGEDGFGRARGERPRE